MMETSQNVEAPQNMEIPQNVETSQNAQKASKAHKIGVVGLGLIGGSIFKSLLNLGEDVIGISQSQTGERIFSDLKALVACDLVFVCTPMNKTLKTLDDLDKILPQTCVVTDVCSLKEFVCKQKRNYNFIPSHPMAGTEHSGFENSFVGLFEDAKWVVTPEFGENGIEILENTIKKLGAKIVKTTAPAHDKAVAKISHMPMLIAQALVNSVKDDDLAKELASSGFRDMTRLAMSNVEMASDMISMNAENIELAVLELYKSVGELTKGDYPKIITDLKNLRSKMY